MRGLRSASVVLGVALLVPALAACNDDDKSGVNAEVSASLAPEDVRASASEVAIGLGKIIALSAKVAATASTDKDTAKQAAADIEPIWYSVEGTVKENDSEAYLTFEDNFAILVNAAADGDSAKALTASSSVNATVKAYLLKHPA